MSNVATKVRSLLKYLAFATIALSAVSCGGGSDTEKAAALLGQAQDAFEARNYAKALELTDSIKNAYPKEIDVRREALHLSTKAFEGLTLRQLEVADSLSAVLAVRGDSLQRQLKFVENPIEGYYVAQTADPVKFYNSTGLQARVSPNGDFYLMSSLKGRSVKSTSVQVSAGGHSASTHSVSHDGERNDRSMGREVITFMGVECDSLGNFINQHVGEPMTLTFVGESTYSTPLPEAQAQEIALLYDYATTVRRFKVTSLEKERLSRAVEISRGQAARTFVDKTTTK